MHKIAVKELAYFICSSGNLTNEYFSNRDLEIGTLAHKYVQSKYNEKSIKEYYIKKTINYLGEDYLVHGFIDGLLNINDEIIIEEIKSTNEELDLITTDYHKEHLAQLKIYAYLYSILNNLDIVHIRLTYVSIVDYETKSFDSILKQDELEDFFFYVLEEYIKFLNLIDDAEKEKVKTIKDIEFPFENKRLGQRDLMNATYLALSNNEILYAIAPTGIGKTMACMFSALKTLKKFLSEGDTWFKLRIAKSYKELNQLKDALPYYMEVIKVKHEWYIYRDIAEIYYLLNKSYKALDFLCAAILSKESNNEKELPVNDNSFLFLYIGG